MKARGHAYGVLLVLRLHFFEFEHLVLSIA